MPLHILLFALTNPFFTGEETCEETKTKYQISGCCLPNSSNPPTVSLPQRMAILNGWVFDPYVTEYVGFEHRHVIAYNLNRE